LKKTFGSSGLDVVGVANVSSESTGEWKSYLEKHGADWTNVSDPRQSIRKRWRLGMRHELENHCPACFYYLLKNSKILGGGYVAITDLWNTPCRTRRALRHAFPDVSIPEELEPSLGELGE
jgi:hypothetical protein